MDDTAKYLIHADIATDGVVERSDVVGAIFGQTEGLLGNDLDLRDLQQSSKVGRIDVEIESRDGQSYGRATIASSLDRVETAILAAALETITRVGPCRSRVAVTRIEDVRAAKRREVVDRAKELLATSFDESVLSSDEILTEVRESVRVEDITDYEGFPAGPRVADSDAILVVEGRADVLTLLGHGIKNAVAVEGTNVPEEVADLTRDRTVTVFLDGDRGGDLILRELSQVGDVDYVARAPAGQSVEDLDRRAVTEALRKKVSFDDATPVGEAATDGSARPAPAPSSRGSGSAAVVERPDDETATMETATDEPSVEEAADPTAERTDRRSPDESADPSTEETADATTGDTGEEPEEATTLAAHVQAVIGAGSGTARLLDTDWSVLEAVDADGAFDAVSAADEVPAAVVIDDAVTQRLLDLAAQRGVGRVVGRERSQYTKRPTAVRVNTAAELLGDS